MLAMPFIIYQIWAFIKPALYEKEKSLAFPLLLSSICLFYSGIAFAYFIALPSILHFFISVSPDTVAPMTDINSYLSFCLKLFLVFGVTFEIPNYYTGIDFNRFGQHANAGGKKTLYYCGLFFYCDVCHATRCYFDDHVGNSNVDVV